MLDGGISCSQHVPAEDGGFTKWKWTISFHADQYLNVHVEEFWHPETQNFPYAAVQFRCLSAPDGRPHPHSTNTTSKDFQSSMLAPVSENVWNRGASLPLARISNNFEEDQYTEILLVFKCLPRTWSWSTAITYLSKVGWWQSPDSRNETKALDAMTLPRFASSLSPYDRIQLASTGSGYWVYQ